MAGPPRWHRLSECRSACGGREHRHGRIIGRGRGVAFDPSTPPEPRPASLAEAKPGGLGLLMIRNFSDDVSYRRSEGRNHLTITVSWTEAT